MNKTKTPLVVPEYEKDVYSHGYDNLTYRYKNLVNQLALNIPKDEIYDTFVSEYENTSYKNSVPTHMRTQSNNQPNKKAKEEYITNIVNKKQLGNIIALKQIEINDIYLDEFRRIAIEKYITKEYISNELVKLKEEIEDLPKKDRIDKKMKLYELMHKVIEKQDITPGQTNIQINNQIPSFNDEIK
jgi:hypothetical protein